MSNKQPHQKNPAKNKEEAPQPSDLQAAARARHQWYTEMNKVCHFTAQLLNEEDLHKASSRFQKVEDEDIKQFG